MGYNHYKIYGCYTYINGYNYEQEKVFKYLSPSSFSHNEALFGSGFQYFSSLNPTDPPLDLTFVCNEVVEEREDASLPKRVAAVDKFVGSALESSFQIHLAVARPPG